MKIRKRPRRFHAPKYGFSDISKSVAHVLADLYFKLAGGNAAHRALAEEFKDSLLEMREEVTS